MMTLVIVWLLQGDVILVGSPGDDDHGSYSGSVYVFEMPETGWSSTTETIKLTASDATSDDYFGYSMSLSTDVIVIGAYRKDGEESRSGAVYVFEKNGENWNDAGEVAKLTSSDETISGYFGYSVSISESTILVGAYGETLTGVAHVFEKVAGNWEETLKLTASDASAFDDFGSNVSISGNVAVIGARGEDDIATSSGAAYVFEKIDDSWEEVIKLKASDAEVYDEFGSNSAVDDDAIVIGVEDKAVCVFEKKDDAWVESAKIISSASNDFFGNSTALSGGMMVIGAISDDDLADNAGAAYVFQEPAEGWSNVDVEDELKLTSIQEGSELNADYYEYGNAVDIDGDYAIVGSEGELEYVGAAYVYQYIYGQWKKVARLTASDGEAYDSFGNSVAIYENTIVIGANRDDDAGTASGAVYVFEKPMDGWVDMTETTKFSASDQASLDYFGCDVDIEGDIIVVGAYGGNGLSVNKGAAYVFVKPTSGWQPTVETAKLYATDTESGDYFGTSVAIEGDIIVINADNEHTYVFEKPADGWDNMTETAKLTTSTGTSTNGSIAIDDEVVVVASSSVYLFEKPEDGWSDMTETAQLSTENSGTEFGSDVAIYEDRVVVGAHLDDTEDFENVGSVYFFDKPADGWSDMVENSRHMPIDGDDDKKFGRSVAITEEIMLVGAIGDNSASVSGGAAYFYTEKNLQHISFDLTDKIYGAAPFALTATSDSPNNIGYQSSDPSVISIAEDGETVTINSSGTVTIIASQEEDVDYVAGRTEQTISVNKAPLTITADNKEMLQGDAVPVLAMSIDGFVYDDSEASIEAPAISTTATGEEAGTFDILLTGGSADNYELTLINGLLTIIADKGEDTDDILSNQTTNTQYVIYPNPAASQLTINAETQIETIYVLDLNGKVLVQEEGSNTIDVSALRSGVYMLRITTSNGHYSTYEVYKK